MIDCSPGLDEYSRTSLIIYEFITDEYSNRQCAYSLSTETRYAIMKSVLSSTSLCVRNFSTGPNTAEQLGKRLLQTLERDDSEQSPRVSQPKKRMPKSSFPRHRPSKEDHPSQLPEQGNDPTLLQLRPFPQIDQKKPREKREFVEQRDEISKPQVTQFRPPSLHTQQASDGSTIAFDNAYTGGKSTGPVPSRQGKTGLNEGVAGVNGSAFQLFASGQEDQGAVSTNVILSELRAQGNMMMQILEKVDIHNKMLSVLIKDYQLTKYPSMIGRMEIQTPEALPAAEGTQNFCQMIGKGPEETVSKKDLYLFLRDPSIDYKYQLQLENIIDLPLVKERNFS